MPKGIYPRAPRSPKTYPLALVEQVREAYERGLTQSEIAAEVGITQKIVWRLMRVHGIERRPAAKRDQRGPKNHAWKGDAAGYSAAHLRVQTARGKPRHCEHCGTTTAKRYDWASLTKNYNDISDYIRLCRSCHFKMDGHVQNLGVHAERKEVPNA